MSGNKNQKQPNGFRHQKPIENRIRVRSRRLDQLDEDKLSLAFWLLAKQLVEDQTDDPASPRNPSDEDDDPDEVAA
jgi:hypothetical protein